MAPTTKETNTDKLVKWIGDMGRKGYFPRSTVGNRVRAIKNVEGVLEENEKGNLDTLLKNVDSIVDRWATLTNAVPSSIQPTKSHLKGLVQDYINYQANPGSFRRGAGKPRSKTTEKVKPKPSPAKAKSSLKTTDDRTFRLDEKTPAININIQINIPADASDAQIDKIFESMAKNIFKKSGE
jgi:hypothetical protein